MTAEQFKREQRYQIAISFVRTLLKSNHISKSEFDEINSTFINKYQPFYGCLYQDIA